VHRVGRTGRAGIKGTAITFITSDECQYASDLIRALENSNSPIPDELKKLDELYQKKVEEGEIEKRKNIGYSGQGYTFSNEEDKKVLEFKKELAKTYGLGLEENEDEDNNDMNKSA
jgi:ATP-dependent RNA helicase DDX46/PRP5